jgi:hypothetical protein
MDRHCRIVPAIQPCFVAKGVHANDMSERSDAILASPM